MSMFCYQCQETARGIGCSSRRGVCGKTETVAKLQDLLIYVVKGVCAVNLCARDSDKNENSTEAYIIDALFTTITNANFDEEVITKKIECGLKLKEDIKKNINLNDCTQAGKLHDSIMWQGTKDQFLAKAATIGVLSTDNEDIRSLRELIVYGCKGIAAYYEHAANLHITDTDIVKFVEQALVATTQEKSVDDLVALVLETGAYAVKTMALLDGANTGTFGNPQISKVNIGVQTNPGILVSGHDFNDLIQLLDQSKEAGVDIYTHSEMLPAHYYPELSKYDHLVANYGSSWWHQDKDFESFNGPILLTTNCIIPVKDSYKARFFTTGSAGYPGTKHIEKTDGKKDFSEIIKMAQTCKPPTEIETGEIIGGFAHHQVLALADQVVEAVKAGAIKKFVVMAGCDARQKDRAYYTEFAEQLPKDTVILTAGCAKYRYNKLPLGDIGGIPRVLDAGQCNDSYSLAVIALKLKEVFELEDINDLPIFYNIAWYEQKAVAVLLALLSLGVKNIHLGPTLPGFLSKNVTNVLVNNFGIAGVGEVTEDIKNFVL